MHYRNIQALATEMYKVANGMAPEIMNEIFQLREKSHYNLRYTTEFIIPPVHSVDHGRESASYIGPKLLETDSNRNSTDRYFIWIQESNKKINT